MKKSFKIIATFFIISCLSPTLGNAEVATSYSYLPPFLTNSMPPMVMLTMARDHRLYYEAYNDASDINGDGIIDVRYNPTINYYGYFDSYKYYEFSTTNDRFEPRGVTVNKKAPDGNYWSGDFLNYVSMTRMDCLRKVLYGGYRYVDTPTLTVLERAYIPQDAHSFGKEYESIDRDKYDIREYTPLPLPLNNRRHLIATTALGTNGKPLLRVLNDSSARIWEWVATERPVVKSNFGGSTTHPGHPNNAAEFATMVSTYADPSRRFGSNTGNNITINGEGNPFGNHDNYLTIFSGTLNIATAGDYTFSIDGDDAVELLINGNVIDGWYGGHGRCGNTVECRTAHQGTVSLTAGTNSIEFRHEEASGGDNYYLYWLKPDSTWEIVPASATNGLWNMTHSTYNLVTDAVITDYTLRVQVGVSSMPEPNTKLYPNKSYKPVGVLQKHGENDKMFFGLMTGSYTKNLSGGVLRSPVGSIQTEINANTGEFLYQDNSAVGGIIKTLDKLRIHGFRNDANFDYNENCGWITTRALEEGECRMWGNPMAEMMYETARYFSGGGSPTSQFVYSANDDSLDDNKLGLPLATWNNPYNSTNYCAKPIMIAISDIFPSYDSDQLPGSAWATTIGTTLGSFHAANQAQTISSQESLNGTYFIGQNDSANDRACTPKTVTSFHNIRGLCPEEPSKMGGYYSAALSYFANINDLHSEPTKQSLSTYVIAQSTPLPEIRIPVGNNILTMVPFAKSVGGFSINEAYGQFQPTNSIVDFFVEQITPTTGTFRVNFEDVEQGADHDMDAIVRYHYEVNSNSTVTITLTSEYAAGSIIHHLGYIISGTTADGTYLVVRDHDTAEGSDPDYYLDTPLGVSPQSTYDVNGPWKDNTHLPLQSSLEFSPGATAGASILKNPLWYAAKWGGFEDANNNNIPDLQSEWDKDADGIPDTYFFVANPTKLEEQLNKAFADILRRVASGSAASIVSQSRSGEGAIYQSVFYPEFKDSAGNTINWIGQTHALFIDSKANMREDTNKNKKLDPVNDKIIVYTDTAIQRFTDTNGDSILSDNEKNSTLEIVQNLLDLNFVWSSSPWLNAMDNDEAVSQRTTYDSLTANRYILTFADKNQNMIADSGEIQHFSWPPASYSPGLTNSTDFYAYLTLFPSFDNTPSDISTLRASNATAFSNLVEKLAQRQIDFIRGADQNEESLYGYNFPATRSRKFSDGINTFTWRLGDVIHSTPTVVGRPVDNYDLIYKDSSYADFFNHYKNRRQVVYTGGNDGMLHSFNGGFYNSTSKGFDQQLTNETPFQIGQELWAYIPYNLLPHLLWLTDPLYGNQLHVSYMDLKPRIFDARVFFKADGVTPSNNSTHPNGWGTLLVSGMRLGGGVIGSDLDKTDGNAFVNGTDRVMSSAYVIMDITNPELPPQVLAEITMPRQGFTTCYPTVMPMSTPNAASSADNRWYLVFGSGPADANGLANPDQIQNAVSNQDGQLYVLDLKTLVVEPEIARKIRSLDSTKTFSEGTHTFSTTEAGSFISDPIAVDLDIGSSNASARFKTNVVYYGTVAGDEVSGKGTLRRLLTANEQENMSGIVTWTGDSALIDVDRPITAAPSAALDEKKQLWVYFGAGRFYNRTDIPQTEHMDFYGIREPIDENTKLRTWATVALSDLYNSTAITLSNGSCTDGIFTPTCVSVKKNGTEIGWATLLSEVEATPGWRQTMPWAWERVLGQPLVYAGATIFTSYTPATDLCETEGTSELWALYYKTGTPYYKPILKGSSADFAKSIPLGKGLGMTPSIHVSEGKPSLFIPTSTGKFKKIGDDDFKPPLQDESTSRSLFWRRLTN